MTGTYAGEYVGPFRLLSGTARAEAETIDPQNSQQNVLVGESLNDNYRIAKQTDGMWLCYGTRNGEPYFLGMHFFFPSFSSSSSFIKALPSSVY